MNRWLPLAVGVALAVAGGCGDSQPPSSPPPGGGGGDPITGRERLGWAQAADSAATLAGYRYALYVDGARRVLQGETCAATSSPNAFDCSAALPTLTPGSHTLELAVFVMDGDRVVESGRSAPLQVTIAGLTSPAGGSSLEGGPLVSSDGLQLQADVLVRALTDPVDLAVADDGRVLVGERSGVVHVIQPGTSGASSTAAENVLVPIARGADVSLASIAISPQFADTGAVHVAYVAVDRNGSRLHIARFREHGGILAQAAVIASEPVAPDASAVARFAPDGLLHVGVGTGSEPNSAQDLASASGKILRFGDGGTRPDDNPWGSAVFSVGHRDPRGLAWHPLNRTQWEVEGDDDGDEVNAVRAGANYGWPLARGVARHPQLTDPALLLPPGTEPSGMTAVAAAGSPLFGDLIVSARGGEDLLRLRPDGSGRVQLAGRLLQGRFGRIGQIAAGADGALYFITANSETRGAGEDLLIRLAPADPPQPRGRPSRR